MVEHLYVHIPFCHRICPYCSFYKHTPGNTDQGAFVEAVLTQLAKESERFALSFKTVYLGGGTPSMLSKKHLARLLSGIAEFAPATLEEWVLEANPLTFDRSKAELMRDHGVSRVSLGIQSWHPNVLKTLGRDHTPAAAQASFETLREAEIASVNIDLMFSVPGQTLGVWLQTIERTLELNPDHVSAYNLTYEEDTKFFEGFRRGEYTRDEETDASFFTEAIRRLSHAGFQHYETSNYARPGHESKHNWAYWNGRDYLGLGPGAVSTINGQRWTTVADTAAYISRVEAGHPTQSAVESLGAEDFALERLGLLIRTRAGLPVEFLTPSQTESISDLIADSLAELKDGRLRLSEKGKLVADSVAAYLAAR